jgi:hypothetical protein
MKISIDAKPGELESRLDEALATVREMAGGDLCKAVGDTKADNPPEWEVVETAVNRARRRQVDRIQRVMQRRFAEVIRASPNSGTTR